MQKIPAAKFKAQCLAVMDQVSQSGQPVIITKRGKPVVKLVPAEMDGSIPTSWRSARLKSRLASATNIWELAWLAENGRIETTMSIESFLWKCVSKVNLLPLRPKSPCVR